MTKPVGMQTPQGRQNFVAVMLRHTKSKSMHDLARRMNISASIFYKAMDEKYPETVSAYMILKAHLLSDIPVKTLMAVLAGDHDGRGL